MDRCAAAAAKRPPSGSRGRSPWRIREPGFALAAVMGAGYVGILSVELHFPEAGSLKGKRKHVKSAKANLQNRFGASVAEVDHHDLWQRARLTVACVAREHRELERCSRTPSDISTARSTSWCRSSEGGGGSAPVSERMRRVNDAVKEVLGAALARS